MRQFVLEEIHDEAIGLLTTGAREISNALGHDNGA